MMAILSKHIVCCLESVQSISKREEIKNWCAKGGKTLIDLSFDEMENFCGNIIQLTNSEGETILVMSKRAKESYKQQEWFKDYDHVVAPDLATIE